MKFHVPSIEDAKWAVPLLEANKYMASEFAFPNIFVWQDYVDTQIARCEDHILIRVDYKGDNIDYQYPSGRGDIKPVIDAILDAAKEGDRPPAITIIPDKGKELLEKLYPDMFDFDNPRGDSDYIYLSSDLADLPGKKYQKKRNHCSRFHREYPNWDFKSIDKDSIMRIYKFNKKWLTQNEERDPRGIENEMLAIQRALDNYEALGLQGGYLTVDDKIAAYSYGSPMGDEFIIHVEKALYDIEGAYAIINREMAKAFGRDYTYMNREEDLDKPGLRKAKLSYRPDFLLNKWRAVPKIWPPIK